jgi:pimeloyl-ACP methyl ester carboxylesterase
MCHYDPPQLKRGRSAENVKDHRSAENVNPTDNTVHVNGIDMFCERRGEGEPLLLLHGGGGAGVNWRLIFDSPPRGYELIVPDLRGHGRSTNPTGAVTFRQLALDVLGLLDRLSVGKVKAIGMSMGAKTLLHLATQQPERVDAMVLVSATPYFPETTRSLMRAAAGAPHTERDWELMRQWHLHGDEQIRALWNMANQFASDYEDMSFTPPRLGRIQAQTLIVHGDRDPLYPVTLAADLHAAIPGSHLWVIPNGGHSPIFGEMAGPFARTALAFLSGEWKRS